MLKETSINYKIQRYFFNGEEAVVKDLKALKTQKTGKLSKIHQISKYVEGHKKCLLDFCLLELYKIITDFLIIRKLDNSRLLFLQRKLNKCKKTILQIMEMK